MITAEDQVKYQEIITAYVACRGKITNRECRKLLPISYNDAIKLLASLCDARVLLREGVSSGTRYVLHNTLPED